MKKIVVTYFEPFGGRTTNASKEVVGLLRDYDVKELPVSWEKVPDIIDEILADEPAYLFLVGEAGNYKEITIEKVAHNIAYGKDNYGLNKDNDLIDKNGPEELKTSFDLADVTYHKSEDAGKYLCNYTYYLALSKAKTTKALFVHLPYINDNLNDLKEMLEDIIQKLSAK